MGACRSIAAPPRLRRLAVSPQFTADRRMRPADRLGYLAARYTGCMQPVYLDALFKAELAIMSSHRAHTLADGALVP